MTKSKIKYFKTLTEKNENHTDPAPETPKKVENEPSEEEHELQEDNPHPNQDLDEFTCDIMRDVNDGYKPLERLFGKLTDGMAFGLTGLTNLHESQKRFYNAIALKDTVCLTLQKSDLLQIIESLEKRS